MALCKCNHDIIYHYRTVYASGCKIDGCNCRTFDPLNDPNVIIGDLTNNILEINEVDSLSIVKWWRNKNILDGYTIAVHFSNCKKILTLRFSLSLLSVMTDDYMSNIIIAVKHDILQGLEINKGLIIQTNQDGHDI